MSKQQRLISDDELKRKKKTKKIVLILFTCFVVSAILGSLFGNKTASASSQPIVFNSALDGSVYQVRDWMNNHANDAASIQYVKWYQVIENSSGFGVHCTFRAKNGFGAYILNDYDFRLDKDGNVVSAEKIQ